MSARPRVLRKFIAVAAIAIVVIVGAGAIWLNSVGGAVSAGIPEATESTPESEIAPAVLDPAALVAILNGTETQSLQTTVEAAIVNGAWGQVSFSDVTVERDVQISAVFYQDVAYEPAARALAEQLGGVSTYQTENYADFEVNLVVLLGSDYAGPGLAEAQAITDAEAIEDAAQNPEAAGDIVVDSTADVQPEVIP